MIGGFGLVLGLGLAVSANAVAEPGAYCARVGTEDAARPLPPALAGRAAEVFGLRSAPPEYVARATVWRCEGGRVLACFAGANLPCGKLDRRQALPAVARWCAGHPGAVVPASVSGHGSLWRWSCRGAQAVRNGAAWQLDGRGFAVETWKALGN